MVLNVYWSVSINKKILITLVLFIYYVLPFSNVQYGGFKFVISSIATIFDQLVYILFNKISLNYKNILYKKKKFFEFTHLLISKNKFTLKPQLIFRFIVNPYYPHSCTFILFVFGQVQVSILNPHCSLIYFYNQCVNVR